MDNEENIYIVFPERSKLFIAKGESAESVSKTNPLCAKLIAARKAYLVMPAVVYEDDQPYFAYLSSEYLSKLEKKQVAAMMKKRDFFNHPASGHVIASIAPLLLDLQEDDE